MLKDKTIFITGAARGIGYGIAKAALENGARVVIADLDADGVNNAGDQLAEECGIEKERVFATEVNVTDEASVAAAMENSVNHFGQLDGLVNNAGIVRLGENLQASSDDWEAQMQVNVIGIHNCCNAFAKLLIEKKQAGSIVNIASNCGKVGYPNMAGYNASKAAVISLTRSLSGELSEHNINVNAVCPGGVRTPMLEECAETVAANIGADAGELLATMVPAQLGRHITPHEIGGVAVFLLSDQALIIRGQSINADGGDTPY